MRFATESFDLHITLAQLPFTLPYLPAPSPPIEHNRVRDDRSHALSARPAPPTNSYTTHDKCQGSKARGRAGTGPDAPTRLAPLPRGRGSKQARRRIRDRVKAAAGTGPRVPPWTGAGRPRASSHRSQPPPSHSPPSHRSQPPPSHSSPSHRSHRHRVIADHQPSPIGPTSLARRPHRRRHDRHGTARTYNRRQEHGTTHTIQERSHTKAP